MVRNRWVIDRRTRGEFMRPRLDRQVSIQADPLPAAGIWYLNPNHLATGDVRMMGILGLYNNANPVNSVNLIIDQRMNQFMQNFLQDCHVITHAHNGILRAVRRVNNQQNIRATMVNNEPTPYATSPNYPGDLFQFQRDIFQQHAPQNVRNLANLDNCVPVIRNQLGCNNLGAPQVLIIHIKKKSYVHTYQNNDLGQNYHEEHKLSFNACIALGIHADKNGYNVYINDDRNRLEDPGTKARIQPKVIALLRAANLNSGFSRYDNLMPLRRNGTLRDQYRDIGNFGTTNVLHIGGRSGHLEFMIYMGQRVIYCEEPGAQGANRILTTLCNLQYNHMNLMQRQIITPTTAGGRAEMEYRDENYQDNLNGYYIRQIFDPNHENPPRLDGNLINMGRQNIMVGGIQNNVDPYKVNFLTQFAGLL